MRTTSAVLTVFSITSCLSTIAASNLNHNKGSSDSLAFTENESVSETASTPGKRRKRSNSLQVDSLIPSSQPLTDLSGFDFETHPSLPVPIASPRSEVPRAALRMFTWGRAAFPFN